MEIIWRYLKLLHEKKLVNDYRSERGKARVVFYDDLLPNHGQKYQFFSDILHEMMKFNVIEPREELDSLIFDKLKFDAAISKIDLTDPALTLPDDKSFCTEISEEILMESEQTLRKMRLDEREPDLKIVKIQYALDKKSLFHDHLIDIIYTEEVKKPSATNKSDNFITLEIKVKNPNTHTINSAIQMMPFIDDVAVECCNIDENAGVKLTLKLFSEKEIIFPVVFEVENIATKEIAHALKEIPLKQKQCLSSTPISKPSIQEKVVKIKNNNIFRGEGLKVNHSEYQEKLALKLYTVPENIKTLLQAASRPKSKSECVAENLGLAKNLDDKNYCNVINNLLYLEEYQMELDIRKFDTFSKLTKVAGIPRDRLLLEVAGLSEGRPSLILGDAVNLKINANENTIYQGVVHQVWQCHVLLSFHKSFIRRYEPWKKYFIQFNYNRRPLRVAHQAIKFVEEHAIAPFLFPKKVSVPAIMKYRSTDYFNTTLVDNPEQRKAIDNILNKSSFPAPYLIFGPPGTGKTTTIVEAILQINKFKPDDNILVCTKSNSAADEIAWRLAKHFSTDQLIRLVGNARGVSGICHEDLIKYSNYKNGAYYLPSCKEILKHKIVICTLVTSARLINGGVPPKHFSYVFLDEICSATEAETIIPLGGILSSAIHKGTLSGQIVLAGDPQQLGPRIHSNIATTYGFGRSILERLMSSCELYMRNSTIDSELGQYDDRYLTKLLKNYRSHPAILKLPNRLFYENELQPMGGKLCDLGCGWCHLPNGKFPIIFHSARGLEEQEKDSPSFFNTEEVNIITNYLNKLIGCELNGKTIGEEEIGVITPYRKQVTKIKDRCDEKNWNKISVGSVENFQGRENLVIMISTVRSKPDLKYPNSRLDMGFLDNPKRFNVAITRAIALLIVVGNPDILTANKYWKDFIDYCNDNRSRVEM